MAPAARRASVNNVSLATSSRQANGNRNEDDKSSFVQKYLTNCKSYYSCIYCRTHLANHDELVSRSFQGNRSRAYLFNSVINISCGPAVQRELNTGSHAVADIFCANCGTTIGWKYEKAYVETQKYKEGKFIIELAHVVRENRHLEFDKRDIFLMGHGQQHHFNRGYSTTLMNARSSTSDRGNRHLGVVSSSLLSSSNGGHSSSSPASSSSNEEEMLSYDDDGVDEELLFPLYDELCSDRSSYPGISSSRLHHYSKIRRSLYLDSTPYDWKYSASDDTPTLSSYNQPPSPEVAIDSGHNSGPGPSCPSGGIPSLTSLNELCDGASTSRATDDNDVVSCAKSCSGSDGDNDDDDDNEDDDDEHETQFKFDADEALDNHDNDQTEREDQPSESKQNCDPTVGHANRFPKNSIEIVVASGSGNRENVGTRQQQSCSSNTEVIKSSSGNVRGSVSTTNKTNSVSLDDEEFYDCCTDHDVTNSTNVVATNSAGPSDLPTQQRSVLRRNQR